MKPVLLEIKVDPDVVYQEGIVRRLALRKAAMPDTSDIAVQVRRRSIDARSRRPHYVFQVLVGPQEEVLQPVTFCPAPLGKKRVIIVGAGPAGYFAALTLLEHGIRPVVLERGKDVKNRRKDIKKLYTQGTVDPHSNYCFGEGGAGAYSDGKLFTRAVKRGNISRILDIFVSYGAPDDIRIDAHPHLGSNVLPRVVTAMRTSIEAHGGEVRFGTHVEDIVLERGRATGVRLQGGETVLADAVILATGHSARDVFQMLSARNIALEAKPFALGVRIEHPQALIDKIFYHHSPRHAHLPAATYRISTQVGGRGVFSFCMCPGGFVVPAATAPGELVLNGMSLAARNAPYANAGLVVELRLEDICDSDSPLAALEFQAAVEQAVFAAGGRGTQHAPAQRVGDFIKGRVSDSLPKTSYIPGLYPAPLHTLLPLFVAERLRMALPALGKKYWGYDSNEAMALAVESRTSSPVRIIRNAHTLEHPAVRGLFPCGEGAGYAGGIVSAAMDGEKVAKSVAMQLQ